MVKLVDFIIVSVIIYSEISNYVWIGVFCYLILLLNIYIGVYCQVSMVRVSIFWLLGEYFERVFKVVLDVLRKMVKIFGFEVRYMMYFVRIVQEMQV